MPPNGVAWTVADGTVQLRDMADEIERFVLAQLDRLERQYDCRSTAAIAAEGSATAAVKADEGADADQQQEKREAVKKQQFHQDREEWETQRQEEADRLRKEAILLQEAWLQFEEEQRRLLAEKELLRRGLPTGDSPAPIADSGTRREALALCPAGSNNSNEEQSAWLQFQRMRREIQSRTRRP